MSTLRKLKWEIPDTPDVNTSEACTAALAAAGGMPRASRKVVAPTPYPMPITPSISWAMKPAMAHAVRVVSIIRGAPR